MLAALPMHGGLVRLVQDWLDSVDDVTADLSPYLPSTSSVSVITFQQWWGILDYVQRRHPDRSMGLVLGQFVTPEHLGALGHLVVTSETLAEALQAFQYHQRLLHDGDRVEVLLRDGQLMLRWSKEYGASQRLSDEVLIMGLLSFIRIMTGRTELMATEVHFTFSEPDISVGYESVLAPVVFYQQHFTAMVFPLNFLSFPVSCHDPALHWRMQQQVDSMLAVLPETSSFATRLCQLLLKAIPRGCATQVWVCRQLHVSERTLFRRLQPFGLTFKRLLLETRMQLAQSYLCEADLSLAEIALLLGYSEQSAFTRAFKRQVGLTPTEYQRRQVYSPVGKR
ncbi:MAG: AraC family transcriptional regulator ligand-binding domain-containing protein [Bacterioplanes sp.]|nr:AraC family transcriptional regulator ligand-binding domain-containing protein [Bacterioplanes sp.]